MSKLWNELCTYKALKDGWHLASQHIKQDFIEISFLKEQFASSLDSNLKELVRQLKTEHFSHQNVIRTSISKGNLSTRPGAFIPLESRIILFAAVKLIAKQLDKHLIEGVFSCRIKEKIKKGLFKESSLGLPPFLKSKTVQRLIDPFEVWYGAWPAIEKASEDICIHGNYPYLAISDISAYFENIQLEILRDQLFNLLPNEQQITNLLISAFTSWTAETPQGRRYMRGIPQGSDISRFFGNLFLAPIDKSLFEISEQLEIKYYRYMDDVRIFAKTEKGAKTALFKFEQEVRGRHLNLQSAKTKILREKPSREVSHLLIDSRLTEFNRLNDEAKRQKDEGTFDKESYLKELSKLRTRQPDAPQLGEQKIKGARKPLTGLSDRLFRRMISTHITLGDTTILPRLLSEISRNNDQRYTRQIIRASRAFPRHKKIQTKLIQMIKDTPSLAPSREANFIQACRYQSRITDELLPLCKMKAEDISQDPQVRVQSLILLARTPLNSDLINIAKKTFDGEENVIIKRAAALILIRQRGNENEIFTRNLVFHPNNELRKFEKYIHACKTNEQVAHKLVEQAFKNEHPWLLVDYLPFLYLQSQSANQTIRDNLKNKIVSNNYDKTHVNMDMRDLLTQLLQWLNNHE